MLSPLMQAWREQEQVWKIAPFRPREHYQRGSAEAAEGRKEATHALNRLGARLQRFPALHAAQAQVLEKAVVLLREQISRRPYDPVAEAEEFAALPKPLSAQDIWRVRVDAGISCCIVGQQPCSGLCSRGQLSILGVDVMAGSQPPFPYPVL